MGASKGENGVYVSLESSIEGLKEQASEFGWNLDALEKKGNILLLKIPLNKSDFDLFGAIDKAIKKIGATRLVFDSLITFSINFDQFKIPLDYQLSSDVKSILGTDGTVYYTGKSKQRTTYLLLNKLSDLGITNIVITGEGDEKQNQITADGVSEYASDGVIKLHSVEGNEEFNTLNVVKMRLTNINRGIYNFRFSPTGITITK